MNGAKIGYFGKIKIFNIFDLQNVNKDMLKNFCVIVDSHYKYKNISLSLYTFNLVIINITFLTISRFAKLLDSKGIQRNLNPFFVAKKFDLLT